MAQDRDDILAELHENYVNQITESGVPRYLLEVYGQPRLQSTDDLPWHCAICGDQTSPGNEYCGKKCGEIYHKKFAEAGIDPDLPF